MSALEDRVAYLERRYALLSKTVNGILPGTPAKTVVTEKAYGQSEAVGSSQQFARADHTHGTVPAGGGGAPADASFVTVDAEAGLSAEYVLGTQVIMSGAIGVRPAASKAGLLYFSTDEHILYRDTGGAWVKVGVADFGDLDGLPSTFSPSLHPILDSTVHANTVSNAPVRGALIVGDSTPNWIRLSPSTLHKVLQIVGFAGDLCLGWVDYTELTSVPASFPPDVHTLLGAYHSDALAAAVVRGDLMIGNSTPKWSKLAKGAALAVLRMNAGGTDPEWAAWPAYPESQTLLADASGVTMTNISTSYVEIPATTACRIKTDMTLWVNCRLVIRMNKVGSGTQSWKLQYCATDAGAFADLTPIIDDAGAAGFKTMVSAWGAIPAGALGDMIVRLVGKSTTAGDDPVIHAVQLQLKP